MPFFAFASSQVGNQPWLLVLRFWDGWNHLNVVQPVESAAGAV
jgi:hypothetical protein